MPSLPTEISRFLGAFVSHWQSYATGGVVTGLITLIERLRDKTLSKRNYVLVFVVAFSLASFFMAWREQFERAENAEARIKAPAPTIQVNIPPINVPPAQIVVNPVPKASGRPLPQMKTLIFKSSPAFTEERKRRITNTIESFYEYLVAVGFDPPHQLPPIGIGGAYAGIYPGDPVYEQSVSISENSVDDAYSIRKVYADYAFTILLNVYSPNVHEGDAYFYRTWASGVIASYYAASFGDSLPANSGKGYNGWPLALWDIRNSCGKDFTDKALMRSIGATEPKTPPVDPKAKLFNEYFRERLARGESVVDDGLLSGLACTNRILNARGL